MSQQINNLNFLQHTVKFNYQIYLCSESSRDNFKYNII